MRLKVFTNLRIRTQIFIFCLLITSILLCVQISSLYFQFIISTNILQDNSNFILNRQYEGSLSTSLKWIESHISFEKQEYIRRTWQINEIFELIQKNQISQIRDPVNCFIPETNNSFHQVFCFAYFAPDKERDLKIEYISRIYQLLNLLDGFILNYFDLYESGTTIFVSDTSEAAFTAYFPPFPYTGFNPQNAFPYTNHFEMINENPNQHYIFSPPYSTKLINSAKKNLQQAITRSLNIQNGQDIVGIIGNTMLSYSDYYDQIPYNILLVNQLCQIQMSSVEWDMNFTEINYFSNVSQTGFNKEDWDQIYQQSKNESFQSNCPDKPSGKSICRYNQKLQRELEIQSFNFVDTNQTLIIMQNMTTAKVINQEFDKLINEIFQLYINFVYWWIGLCLVCYIICILCIHFISKSWIKIMEISKQFVKQFGNNINKNITYLFKSYEQRKSLQSKFEQAFYRLYDTLTTSQNKKCQQCNDISNFQYNFKGYNPEWILLYQEVIKKLDQIKDIKQYELNIELIQQYLRQ